jgi:hypothetical protein
MGKNRQTDLLASSENDERYKLLPNEGCKIIRTGRHSQSYEQNSKFVRNQEVSSTSIDSSEFFIFETKEQSIKKGDGGSNLILPIQKLGMNIDCWNEAGDPGKLFFKMEGGFPSSNLSVKNREEVYPLILTNDSEICYAEVGQLNDAEILFELIAPKLTWPLASVKKDNVSSRMLIIDGNISHHEIRFQTTVITNLKERMKDMKISIFVEMIDWEKNTTLVKFDAPVSGNINFKDQISNLIIGDEVVAYRVKNIKITDEYCAVNLDKKVNLDNLKSWNILQTSSHDLVLSTELCRSKSTLDLQGLVTNGETPRYAYFNSERELEIEDFPNILEISNSNFIKNCRILQGGKYIQYEIYEKQIKRIPDNNKLKLKFDLTDVFRELVKNNIFENITQAMDVLKKAGYVSHYVGDHDKIIMDKTDEKVFLIRQFNDSLLLAAERDMLLIWEWGGKTESGTTWQMMVGRKSRMELRLRCGDIIEEFNRKKIETSVQLICVRMKDDWGTWGDDGMKSIYYLICKYLDRFRRSSTLRQYYLEIDGQNKRKMKYENIKIFDNEETERILHIELGAGTIENKNIKVLSILGRVVLPNGSSNDRKIFWEGSKGVLLEDIKMISNDQDLIDLGIKKINVDTSVTEQDVKSKGASISTNQIKRGENEQARMRLITPPKPPVKGPNVQSDRAAALIEQSRKRAMVPVPKKRPEPPKGKRKTERKPKRKPKPKGYRTVQNRKTQKLRQRHDTLKKQLNTMKRNKPEKHWKQAEDRLERFEKEYKEFLDI